MVGMGEVAEKEGFVQTLQQYFVKLCVVKVTCWVTFELRCTSYRNSLYNNIGEYTSEHECKRSKSMQGEFVFCRFWNLNGNNVKAALGADI